MAETRDGKVAVCFAAAFNHINCLSYLIHHEHDTYSLMDDRKVKIFKFLINSTFLSLVDFRQKFDMNSTLTGS